MALAGGVNIITSPNLYQNLFAASFLNPNGSSMAFDAAASGYCRGEGIGLLLLKPLSRAIANGDTVLGTIAGSAVNQNSNCTSITVPHSQSQSSLYNRALTIGRINPNEVTYVEAHGTGEQFFTSNISCHGTVQSSLAPLINQVPRFGPKTYLIIFPAHF